MLQLVPAAVSTGMGVTKSFSLVAMPMRKWPGCSTGSVQVTTKDPRAAADAVVSLVEGEGGRVDARTERAATDGEAAHAQLTVRVPANDLTTTLARLKDIGDVGQITLSSQDVTADSQDLDARIKALQISVARLEDLLARATTSAELVSAEDALTQRQSNLETLQSQRARLAEQVALSTLEIDLSAPGSAPAATPHGFWGGIVVGWRSLVAVLRGVVLVVGVLLPWLAFGAVVTTAVIAVVRFARRRRDGAVVPPPTASLDVRPPTA